jgi:disulfide bond formation protein DsbB
MKTAWNALLLAWLTAMVAALGALFIGEVMLMPPCNLCWYQRIFMFPMAIILGLACFDNDRRGAVYAWPFALAGSVLAAYHCLLVAGLIPKGWIPCGAGVSCANQQLAILDGIQIPWLSFMAFVAVLGLLTFYLKKTSK